MVSRIQQLRKDLDLAMETRIHLKIESQELTQVLEEHGAYIAKETLAVSFNGAAFEAMRSEDAEINGKVAKISLAPVSNS